MKMKNTTEPTDKNNDPDDNSDRLAGARELINDGVDLISTKVLEGLQQMDWDKWQRRHCIPRTRNMADLARLLCALSRILRPLEKERDRKAAQRGKFKADFRHIIPFLDSPGANHDSDNEKSNNP